MVLVSPIQTEVVGLNISLVVVLLAQFFATSALAPNRFNQDTCIISSMGVMGASLFQLVILILFIVLLAPSNFKRVVKSNNGKEISEEFSALNVIEKLKLGSLNVKYIIIIIIALLIIIPAAIGVTASVTKGVFTGTECFPEFGSRMGIYMLLGVNTLLVIIFIYILHFFKDCKGNGVMDILSKMDS